MAFGSILGFCMIAPWGGKGGMGIPFPGRGGVGIPGIGGGGIPFIIGIGGGRGSLGGDGSKDTGRGGKFGIKTTFLALPPCYIFAIF